MLPPAYHYYCQDTILSITQRLGKKAVCKWLIGNSIYSEDTDHPPVMIFFHLCLSLLLLLFLCPLNLQAENNQKSPSQTLAIELQQHYGTVESLSFSFIQTTSGQMSGRPKTGKGNAFFARTASGPQMRWNYNVPDRQVLISDGQTILMYFEQLNQMIIATTEETQVDVLFSFFTGTQAIAENFFIMDAEPPAGTDDQQSNSGLDTLSLVPQDRNSQISVITIWIDRDRSIRRLELIDHFGTKTVINLLDIKVNQLSLPADQLQSLFAFEPPEGTEIIQQ